MSFIRKYPITITGSVLVGWSLYIFLFFSHYETFPSFFQHLLGYASATIASIVCGVIFLKLNSRLDDFIPWRKSFPIRFFMGLISGLALSAGVVCLFFYGYAAATFGSMEGILAQFSAELIKMLILLFFTLVVFESVYFVFYSYYQYAVVQAAAAAEDRKQRNLQFEALKSQLSPHFLFNSLNTISSLVYKDKVAAEEFVRRLAVTYQYVIDTDKEMLVSLENEVEFIRSYYHLLKVRFEDALNIDINLPEDLMTSVIPPLTLQILIENAVKHNTVDKENPLDIAIHGEDDNYLIISNTIGRSPSDVKSFGVGLDNIKKRYAFYTPRNIKIENDMNYTVHLPVIQRPELQLA